MEHVFLERAGAEEITKQLSPRKGETCRCRTTLLALRRDHQQFRSLQAGAETAASVGVGSVFFRGWLWGPTRTTLLCPPIVLVAVLAVRVTCGWRTEASVLPWLGELCRASAK